MQTYRKMSANSALSRQSKILSVVQDISCVSRTLSQPGPVRHHRNLEWRVDNNHHQQPIPGILSVPTSTALASIYNWYGAHNDNVHLCPGLYNARGGNITFWSRTN